MLLCGEHVVTWEEFQRALTLLVLHFGDGIALLPAEQLRKDGLSDLKTCHASEIAHTISNGIRRSKGGNIERLESLESLVCELTQFETSDPRDAIYALMTLAKDITPPFDMVKPTVTRVGLAIQDTPTERLSRFTASYDVSIAETFKNFVAHCISTSGSLDILCRKWAPNKYIHQLRQDDKEALRLPSWVGLVKDSAFGPPDAIPRVRRAGDSIVGPPELRRYNASGNEYAKACFGNGNWQGSVSRILYRIHSVRLHLLRQLCLP